ncbi:hypothetical protein EBB79_20395 [Parasedimentitalea marina]|uniref:Uncharacterized protein n=1 Tax=Parasedimentitalea marina TaxID=2483033 RepID=A0A3T0N7R8_9RHOB|nr:hypothetical protein EBB79_20395 [Parasedimentitalea marina]
MNMKSGKRLYLIRCDLCGLNIRIYRGVAWDGAWAAVRITETFSMNGIKAKHMRNAMSIVKFTLSR